MNVSIATGGIPLSLLREVMVPAKKPKVTLAQIAMDYHYRHNIDSTEHQPYCTDCEVYL